MIEYSVVSERLSGSGHALNESGLFGERKARDARDKRPLAVLQSVSRHASRQKNTRNHRDCDQFGTHDNFLPAKK